MGFYDDVVADQKRAGSTRSACSLARIRTQASPEQLADIDRALADKRIYGAAIARKLSELFELTVKGNTVQRHRNGECSCG